MNQFVWTRRSFMKRCVIGAFMLLARPAFGDMKVPNLFPEGRLPLYNTHTSEKLDVIYRDGFGKYDSGAIEEINHFMRCHYTQKVFPMDIRVIEFVNWVHKRVGGNYEIQVVSGYRSPEYNQILMKEGGVAKNSLHLLGKAIDIRIPGVGIDNIRETAMKLEYGGVGYYPKSGFVHLDSGDVRSW